MEPLTQIFAITNVIDKVGAFMPGNRNTFMKSTLQHEYRRYVFSYKESD